MEYQTAYQTVDEALSALPLIDPMAYLNGDYPSGPFMNGPWTQPRREGLKSLRVWKLQSVVDGVVWTWAIYFEPWTFIGPERPPQRAQPLIPEQVRPYIR